MTVLARCWKRSEIVKIELTRVILCLLPSCLDLNATRNHTPSAQLNQPRLLQKARRYRHRLRLAGSSSNAPGLPPHITPTDGSWLNLIERWFELLRNIRIGGAHVGDKVERALKDFTEATDDTLLATPKAFVWTKPADEILASMPRFAGATKQIHGSSFMQDNNDSPQQNSSHHPKIAAFRCL